MSGDWAGPGFSTPYADPDMDPAHAQLGRLAAEVKRSGKRPRSRPPTTNRCLSPAARQATEPEPEAG